MVERAGIATWANFYQTRAVVFDEI